jgi:type VI secretion system protein ImpA
MIMSELIEQLLQPLPGEKPCGEDLSYDPSFAELETLFKGKPEVEYGDYRQEAVPPDWAGLKKKAVEFLGRSKDLRVTVMLCGALLNVDGLRGFRDGLFLLRGLLEQYWNSFHPLLDPQDNDPIQRINILNPLAPEESQTSWFVQSLGEVALCASASTGAVSFNDVQMARKQGGEGQPPASGARLDLAQVGAAFRSANPEEVQANYEAVGQAVEAVAGIDTFLTNTVGATQTVSFDVLHGLLQQMEGAIAPYLPTAATPPAAPDGAAQIASSSDGAMMSPGVSSSIAVAGPIRSREDVVKTLDRICDYYRQVEPGSPVPYLLRRAQKLAQMSFVDAVEELGLAGLDQLRPSMGSALDNP